MIARVALVPRDGLFCKDGRGWHTSASGRGHGLDWPWPSTVLGALRTAWGRAEEAKGSASWGRAEWSSALGVGLGRSVVLRRPIGATWIAGHRVWRAPADALRLDAPELHRLEPGPPRLRTLGRDDDEARESLWVAALDDEAKPLPAPRFWSEQRFCAWLSGKPVPTHDPGHAFDLPRRIVAHVGIQPDTLTAEDGILFSHDVVETLARELEWAIGVELDAPSSVAEIATLGADGRLAWTEPLDKSIFAAPGDVLAAFREASPRGLRLVVATPACFARGWLPDRLDPVGSELRGPLPGVGEVVLRAAMVPRPIHVSGWDMAQGAPKPTLRMVPAGAVYFFQRSDGSPFSEDDAAALWLAGIGQMTGEGFGRVVPGVWTPDAGRGTENDR